MPLVEWDDSLSIGIDAVDNDHKILIELVNQVMVAMDGGDPDLAVGIAFDTLVEYTKYHFLREERVQEAVGYPGLSAHRAIHENLKATVMDMHGRYLADPSAADLDEICRFLCAWLIEHITKEDAAMAPYVTGRAEAEEAANSVRFMGHIDLDKIEDDPFVG